MMATLLTTSLPLLTDPSYENSTGTSVAGALLGLLFYLLYIAVIVAVQGLMWGGVFKKAGYESWKAYVPFYSWWIIVKIAGRPESHFWFMFIPYFNIYIQIVTLNDIAKSFGKDSGYTVGLVLLPIVFATMLSYGAAPYRGPSYVSPEQRAYQQQAAAAYYAQQQYAQQQYVAQQYAAQQAPDGAADGAPQPPTQENSGPTKEA